MKVAVIGVTGLVGQKFLEVLQRKDFPVDILFPVASKKSVGEKVEFKGEKHPVISIEEAINSSPDIAFFSAGGSVSLEYAPRFAEKGTVVIDNSSAWRMHEEIKLVVPEINGNLLDAKDKIIANPNCSTIQMVIALNDLHLKFRIKRIVVSTYQSVTGTGKKAVDQLMAERREGDSPKVYPHEIDLNAIPHIDTFLDNLYTKEEMKMVNETRKIFGDQSINVTATCVRLPVLGGHSESINVEFHNGFQMEEVIALLSKSHGVKLLDDIENNVYPMPKTVEGHDQVFVGRIRKDESQENTLNMWVVADNLLKGAATNAVQIAEHMIKCKLIPS